MSKDYLGTYNGTVFYPLSNETYDVNLEAIAFSLSNNTRFCGHTKEFWSVAQHSLLVSKVIKDKLCSEIRECKLDLNLAMLYGLLHDASEAYLSDICRPIKQYLPDYKKYEQLVQTKILKTFGLYPNENFDLYMKFVTVADDTVLYAEANRLMNPSDLWKEDYKEGFSMAYVSEIENCIQTQNIQIVEALFIDECITLLNSLNSANGVVDKLQESSDLDSYKPLYKEGKIRYYFKENGETYSFYDSKSQEYRSFNKEDIDNTLDLFKWIDKRWNYET